MTRSIVYTRHDGGVSVCHPAQDCLSWMGCGGYWNDRPRGFMDEQIDRQIAAGHQPFAAERFARALAFGGCTTAEALEIIRDRDCGHLGTAHELWNGEDLPSDRWFRDAWRRSHNGGPIYIDMRAARPIHFKKIRAAVERENNRRKLEIDFAGFAIDINWQKFRDCVVACNDVNNLRRLIPDDLRRLLQQKDVVNEARYSLRDIARA